MRICTTNPGKMREFGGLLSPLGLTLKPSSMSIDIPETEDSFAGNSRLKAREYARYYPGEWILAEDSGLVVPALGGMPGPWSARFAEDPDRHIPRDEIDPLNNAKVLALLKGTPSANRGAWFVSHITVVNPQGDVAFSTERRAYGWIATEAYGSQGFGYDPIFISDSTGGKTWAEIDAARKDLISHRNHAIWDLMAWLCSQDGIQ
jgi:non-canonical purine NTP pyrophosphatase (RdgB/HAM1 family)